MIVKNATVSAAPNGMTVLVTDDVGTIRRAVRRIVELCGCIALEADSIKETYELLEAHRIDLIFLNLYLPRPSAGERALIGIKKSYPDLPVVLTSCAVVDFALRRKYQSLGAHTCLQLPFYEDKCAEVLCRFGNNSDLRYLTGIN